MPALADLLMPSEKHILRNTYATGLISSLINITEMFFFFIPIVSATILLSWCNFCPPLCPHYFLHKGDD